MNSLRKKIIDYSYRFRPLPDYYGEDFKKAFAFLMESRNWCKEKIRDYKLKKLRALLSHAQNNVPYYRNLFSKHGIRAEEVDTLVDFAKIPVLTKDSLRANFEDLKADNFESYKPLKAKTAGTTGQITDLYRSRYHESVRRAALWRVYHQFGYSFKEKRVTVDDPPSFSPDSPLYEYDKIENEMIINTYHLMSGRAGEIYDAIRNFQPRMIWGHPTFMAILGDHVKRNGLKPLQIPIIATYAEKIYPQTRQLIKHLCTGEFVEYYGNKENSIGAWGFSNGKFFEISEYCHFEVEDGAMADSDGKPTGDLITTSLHNYAFPLIRYKPNDIATMSGYVDDKIPYPQIELHGGRGKDLLVTREGLTIPHLVDYLERNDFRHLRKHQIEQTGIDDIIVRIVPETTYDKKVHEPLLLKLAMESTANKFNVTIEYVDDIPLTERGKFPAIISKLAVDQLAGNQ
jgi:phenylacetate-CoA ligase